MTDTPEASRLTESIFSDAGSVAKQYDIVRLDPQDEPIYFIVEAFSPTDPETTAYWYDEGTCPTNWLKTVDTIIINGDSDPHGLFAFVRTTMPLTFPRAAHYPDQEWPKIVPEAYQPDADFVDERASLIAALREAQAWMPRGDRSTPEQRGAKCGTLTEAYTMIDNALRASGEEV